MSPRATMLALACASGVVYCSLAGISDGDGGADASRDVVTSDAKLSYSAVVLSDGPAMYLRLGEASGPTAIDLTGDKSSGTYPASGVTYGVPGAIANDPDTAVGFDGQHSISIPARAAFDFAGTPDPPFSVEVWARQTSYEGVGVTIDHDDWDSGRDGWDVLFAGDHVGGERWANGSTNNSHTETDAALPLGAFHHVVTTFDGTAYCLYVDGAQVHCNPFASFTLASTQIDWAIGAMRGCANPCKNGFVGALDEFALYTYALTAERIAVHYTVGTGG